jgi:hypothetical protein
MPFLNTTPTTGAGGVLGNKKWGQVRYVLFIGIVYIKKFLVRTTSKSLRLMAHSTGRCLETKEAFKADRAGSEIVPAFFIIRSLNICYVSNMLTKFLLVVISYSTIELSSGDLLSNKTPGSEKPGF